MEPSENENIRKARVAFLIVFVLLAGLFVLVVAHFAQTSSGEGNVMAKKVNKFKNDSALMYVFSAKASGLQKRLLDTTVDTATIYRQIQGSLDSLKTVSEKLTLDTPGNHHFYINVLTSIAKLKQSVIALRSKGQTENLSDLKEQKSELQNSLNLCQLKQPK